MKLKIANGDIGEAQRDPWVTLIYYVFVNHGYCYGEPTKE
jgi:hypothetical protein